MKIKEIRRKFLDFFVSKNHTEVPSSSLLPHNDPTLLFTNAGMNQFKDLFLGAEQRDYLRAVTAQKCVRAGGKHNDLENVGYTARHHTFFEMLGNFSFGDYFKEDAIKFAWELLTQVYKIPEEKLLVTIYHNDEEAFSIWREQIGLPEEKIIRIGDLPDGTSDNFWQMGDTGPCGPSSEIFYDHGEAIFGGPPGSKDEDGDRFTEIWNLVFMQYNRDEKGNLHPLPKPSIDTGMGLERIAAVLQGVTSNYETDLFRNLIQAAAKVTETTDLTDNSLKVISDHIRAVTFLISDGIRPSNEGRGYVLRRIIRRAIRHGYTLGKKEPFLHQLVDAVVAEMGEAYPEIAEKTTEISATLLDEENRFLITLEHGLTLLEQDIANLKGTVIPGETIFKLYDTYGFPVDLTNDIAREQNLSLDMDGFERCMEEQRARARAASDFSANTTYTIEEKDATIFKGYDTANITSKITTLLVDGESSQSATDGSEAVLLLKETPFYPESGGQVGDTGYIRGDNFTFLVKDTQKQHENILHIGVVTEGTATIGDQVSAQIDNSRRDAIRKNHSATHLLHAILRKTLGTHIEQKGSLVTDNRLRFDFSHNAPLTFEELETIEQLVNAEIMRNHPVEAEEMALEAAKERGAMALFGEKYGDEVRVIQMGDSIELCGGTHVHYTGDIGPFKILSETGIASGVRRIEAVTATDAQAIIESQNRLIHQLADLLNTDHDHILSRVEESLNEVKSLRRELASAQSALAFAKRGELLEGAFEIAEIPIILGRLEGTDNRTLRELCDNLQAETAGITLLISAIDGRVALVSSVDKRLNDRIKAGDLLNIAAAKVGGKGGGRPTAATGGGSHPEHINDALKAAKDWLEERLS